MTGSGQPISVHDVSGKQYTINPKHRTNVAKSDCTQWVVPETDELELFGKSVSNGYMCLFSCYWWAIDKDIEPHLGETDVDKAYIAKFVSDNNELWHGYPITGLRKGDIPDSTVIQKWKANNIIKKKYISDLMRGRGYV